PATLAATLLARHDAAWLPGHAVERYDTSVELAQAARLAGDRELATEALLLQATALLELADARAIGRFDEFLVEAENLHHARSDYLAATRRVTKALIAGDVETFRARFDEAHALAEANDEPDAPLV